MKKENYETPEINAFWVDQTDIVTTSTTATTPYDLWEENDNNGKDFF